VDDSNRGCSELLFLFPLILVLPVFADNAGGFIEPLAIVGDGNYRLAFAIFDIWLKRLADGVEKVLEHAIARCFLRRPAQRGDFGEVSFQRVHVAFLALNPVSHDLVCGAS
jgi:hypothetical protein